MPLPRRPLLLFSSYLALAITSIAFADADSSTQPKKNDSRFVFSLLPKSMQRNPRIDLTVVTEMTDDGRKLGAVSPSQPRYYLAHATGFHAEGGEGASEQPVEVQRLQKHLERSLAESGYLPSDQQHTASILLIYVWGIHTRVSPDQEDVGYANLLGRAKLVGGVKFAEELNKVISETMLLGLEGGGVTNPLYRFIERDDTTRQLWEQIVDDCYYLVVSAYDNAAAAQGKRKLLWRTKMTTAAQGVGLRETLPAMVTAGTTFFGRESAAPSVVEKRINRSGNVEIGEATVKDYFESPAKGTEKGTKE